MLTYSAILRAPMCHVGAIFTGDSLTRLDFLPADTPITEQMDMRARRLASELEAYWGDASHVFDLNFAPSGTPFQEEVWNALRGIPVGQSTTYGALARLLGTGPRAVGQACGSNPLPIVIPCHRVVAAGGLGGFMHASSGAPLDVKSWLLAHERRAD